MVTVLKDGLITGSATVPLSEGGEAMFKEVVDQLMPCRRVRLDVRRFTEISIDGPRWTHDNDTVMQHFALRFIAGEHVVFDCGFRYDNRVELKADSWLYVPLKTDFRVTTGQAKADYPCTFVLAQLITQ